MRAPLPTRPSRLPLAALAALLCGCTAAVDARSVTIAVSAAPDVPRPEHLTLSWLDDDGFLIRARRVPDRGLALADGPVLATIRLSLDSSRGTDRRVIVDGIAGGETVGQAVARIPFGVEGQISVRLQAGRLHDADADLIPDEVDSCPLVANAEQVLCPDEPVDLPDAGAGPVDAAVDRAPAPPPDTRPADTIPARDAGADSGCADCGGPPVLRVERGVAPAAANLTGEGPLDWMHWGLTLNGSGGLNQKKNGQILSTFSNLGIRAPVAYDSANTTFSWNNGTPVSNTRSSRHGVYFRGRDEGARLAVPASSTLRTLRLFVSAHRCRGKLAVRWSDDTAPRFVDDTLEDTVGQVRAVVYEIQYRSDTPGQRLVIDWTQVTDTSGSIAMQAVTVGE